MTDAPTESPARPSFWILVIVGLVGGALSGAFGIGGGILMVPLLIGLAKMNQRQAAATSLLAIVPAAIAGSATYFAAGHVDWFAALFLAVGGVVGSIVGTRLLKSLPLGILRWGFIALLVAVAVRMVLVIPDRGSGVGGIVMVPFLHRAQFCSRQVRISAARAVAGPAAEVGTQQSGSVSGTAPVRKYASTVETMHSLP